MNLDKYQSEAVKDHDGIISVLAGPGSGKTRVLIERTFSIIENNSDVNPDEILIISFTNKVRQEIRERLYNKNPLLNSVQVHTFHSFAILNLRRYCDYIDIVKNFTILDTESENIILDEIYDELGLSKKDLKYRKMMELIEDYKNNNFKNIPSELLKTLPNIINLFESKKKFKGYFSFDDVLDYFNNLLETPAGQLITEKIKYVMCDEAQDLNKVQFSFINLLMNCGVKNFMLVGDLDQAIYEWRGAKPELFHDFFKKNKQYILKYNYRTSPNIIVKTNKLISNNKSRVSVEFETTNKEHKDIVYQRFLNKDEFKKHLIDEIKNKLDEGVKPNDIAILYRNNYLSREYEKYLTESNIPYVIYNGVEFYNRKEIKDTLAFLKVIYNPTDEVAWTRILKNCDGIGAAAIKKIKAVNSESWFDKIYTYMLHIGQKNSNYNTIKFLLDLFAVSILDKNIEDLNYYSIVSNFIEKLKYKETIWNDESYDERNENFIELMETMRSMYESGMKLTEYIDSISLTINKDEFKPQDCIKLMTMHSSKGLEFDTVFILGAVDDIIPGNKTDEELDAERRLMYVSMTRAKKHLFCFISNVNVFNQNGMSQSVNPSRFFKESLIN